jgi:hypothetical protein
MVYKLSPSGLSLMLECPRCFWLTQHKIWKRPNGIFPSLPSGMDAILKKHFDRFCDKGVLPPELCNNGECKNLKLFNEPEKMKNWRNNLRGIRYEDEKGNLFFGAIDNIMTNGKKLIVLDYKTRGYPCKDDTHIHYQNQLNIYNYLLRKNGYETEDFAFLLFYFPKDVNSTGEIIFDTTLKKITIDVKDAEEIFEKALKLLEGNCPKKCCEWCEGRK